MSKKQIFVIVIVVLLVAALAVGGIYFYDKQKNPKKAVSSDSVTEVAGTQTLDPSQARSNTIPLGGENQKEESSSSLSVSNSAPSNSAQLGSGYKPSTNNPSGNNSNSDSANSVPGPETFGQYEQYKTSQTSLYGDIQVGTGSAVTGGKKAAVIYKGYLTNGQLFDENIDTNKPFIFTPGAGQVIKGWEESLPGMKVGGIRRIIVPPAVGYGATAQAKIPANSVLVFDVQVVAVE